MSRRTDRTDAAREPAGSLRRVVRQELVSRQLAPYLPPDPRVLDAGSGQGALALALARRGARVTCVERSALLLDDLREALSGEPPEVRARVRLQQAEPADLAELVPEAGFDTVLCHGALVHPAGQEPLIAALARALAPGGLLSLLVRNGDAPAMRAGLHGDWTAALHALQAHTEEAGHGADGASRGSRDVDTARALTLAALHAELAEHDLMPLAHFGVRVFTDIVPPDVPVPPAHELAPLIAAEELAGRTDPYRAVAPLLHVLARRRKHAPVPRA